MKANRESRLRKRRNERFEKRRLKLMREMGVALPQKRSGRFIYSEPSRAQIIPEGAVPVNERELGPNKSYSIPDFVARGFYVDVPFECKDCGKEETWSATRQKWWYEVAKGDMWTSAIRCRACRQKERKRRAEARKVHLEGLAKKLGQRH